MPEHIILTLKRLSKLSQEPFKPLGRTTMAFYAGVTIFFFASILSQALLISRHIFQMTVLVSVEIASAEEAVKRRGRECDDLPGAMGGIGWLLASENLLL